MILFYLLISILASLIFVLVVPIDIELTYNNQAQNKSRTRITWLFGLISFDVKEIKKSKFKIKTTKPLRHKEKKRKEKTDGLKSVLVLIQSKGFLRRVIRLIREIIAVAEIGRLDWHLGFGLDDPADTGRVYGMLSPAFSFMYACPRIHFSFVPLFGRMTLETKINAAIRIVPMKFVLAVLSFIFSAENFRAINAVIKAN